MQITIELKAIKEAPSEWDRLESRIKAVFKKYLYIPLLHEFLLPTTSLQNAKDDLIRAIQRGTLQYSDGFFEGYFDATVTKELRKLGAKWDKKTDTFYLPK